MFAELFAFEMANVDECDTPFGALEIVVFHVTGEEDVGLLCDGIVDKETACAAADGNAADGGGGKVAGAQEGEMEAGFYLLQKGLGG